MPRFAKVYDDFDVEYKSVLAEITASQAALALTPDQVTAYTQAGGTWATAFAAYKDGNTRTESDIAQVKVQYNDMRHRTSAIQQQIKNNPSVTLSEEDRMKLYIHKDKETRTPSSRPVIAPTVFVIDTKRLTNEISITYPDSQGENHRALPDDVKTVVRLIAVTETPEAPARDAYNEIDAAAAANSRITWPEADANKFGWVIVMYQNNVGELGPESAALMMPIMG